MASDTPINQLLEKALDVVTEAEGHAFTLLAIFRGDTGCAIDLVASLKALVQEVEEQGEVCIEKLDGLTLTVEASQRDLTAASDAAEEALRRVENAAPGVGTHAESMETHTQEKTGQMAAERTQADSTLHEAMANAREDATRLDTATDALAALLSTRAEETRTSLGELREAVAHARAELAEAGQRFLDAAAHVDAAATEDGRLYVAGIQALVQEEATHLTLLANFKVETHNQIVGPMRHRMTEDEPRATEEMAQAVMGEMAPIIGLCDQRDDQLVTAAEKLEPLAEHADSRLEQIVTLAEIVLAI